MILDLAVEEVEDQLLSSVDGSASVLMVPDDRADLMIECIRNRRIALFRRDLEGMDPAAFVTAVRDAGRAAILAREREGLLKEQVRQRNREIRDIRVSLRRELDDRKRTEKELERERNYFRNLFENSPEGVVLCDNEGTIVRANDRFYHLFGYSMTECLGVNIDTLLVPEEHLREARHVTKMVINGHHARFEGVRRKKNGALLDVLVMAAPLVINGKHVGTCGIYQDITEIKNTENELEDFAEQLEALNRELIRTSRHKDEFISNTSHELRTPLNAIIGLLKLIEDGLYESDEEMMQFISISHENATNLLSIINDILDMARIEAGKIELEEENVNINSLFDEMELLFRASMKQKGIELVVEHLDEGESTIWGDHKRLKQILTNLIGNSLKFTEKGNITLKAAMEGTPDRMLIVVKDTGIGIDNDAQGNLFEPFIQEDGSTRRKYGGTGLGLSICQKLVNAMGGKIWIESKGKGMGTSVSFTLPMGRYG